LFALLLCCSAARAGFANWVGLDAEVADRYRRAYYPGTYGNQANMGPSLRTSTLIAETVLMRAIRGYGLRSKIHRLNTYVGDPPPQGDGIADFRVQGDPLIHDKGDARDIPSAQPSAWTYVESGSSGGLSGGGSQSFTTGFVPATMLADTTKSHLMIYQEESSTETAWQCGSCGPSGQDTFGLLVTYTGVGTRGDCYGAGNAVSDAGGVGHYLVTKSTTGTSILYKNGVAFSTTTGLTQSAPNSNTRIFALCFNNGGGTAPTNRKFGGYEIGADFSATDVANDYAAWQEFQTLMGRQK